jgi:hypothetical protein
MPREYNIPDWYSPEYERLMHLVIAAVKQHFSEPPEHDESYEAAREVAVSERQFGLYHVINIGGEIFYDGPNHNVGYNAMKFGNCYIFRLILPSYIIATIEVYEDGSLMSEYSEMSRILAEQLLMVKSGTFVDDAFMNSARNGSNAGFQKMRDLLVKWSPGGAQERQMFKECLDGLWPEIKATWPFNPRPELNEDLMNCLKHFTPQQLQTIRSTLDLLAMRENEDEGETARLALDQYWRNVPPLPEA